MLSGAFKKGLLAGFLAAALALPALAENPLVGFYDSELVKVSYQTFGGLTLVSRGQSSSAQIGVSSVFKDILSDFRDSREAFESYASKNRLGNILIFGGLACTIGSVYYPMVSPDTGGIYGYGDTYRTSIYLMVGGLAAEVIGSFLVPASLQDLLNSVNLYNREKLALYK
jgi:hypothetical protein